MRLRLLALKMIKFCDSSINAEMNCLFDLCLKLLALKLIESCDSSINAEINCLFDLDIVQKVAQSNNAKSLEKRAYRTSPRTRSPRENIDSDIESLQAT